MINTAPQFGFLVFLPTFFTKTIGFSLSGWLQLLSYMFLSNIIWNLFMGICGDKLGWRQTVAYVGGVGCAIATLLLYYIPSTFRSHYSLAVLVAVLVALALARVIPGRPGYWLDLGLVMFALYLVGCTVGSWLRDWVLSGHAPVA